MAVFEGRLAKGHALDKGAKRGGPGRIIDKFFDPLVDELLDPFGKVDRSRRRLVLAICPVGAFALGVEQRAGRESTSSMSSAVTPTQGFETKR